MNRKLRGIIRTISLIMVFVLSMGVTVMAEENDESTDIEQLSFLEDEDQFQELDEFDSYVDGIYNVNENARAAMTGIIRLGKSGSKLVANYTTSYSYSVDKIGIKNLKLQYKGSLGIWHTITTLDDRYRTNSSLYQGAFSCTGVIGRTYRLKATHYIVDDSYTETRNNVTEDFTF